MTCLIEKDICLERENKATCDLKFLLLDQSKYSPSTVKIFNLKVILEGTHLVSELVTC